MICVSIGRGRHKHMIAEHRHLVDQGCQLVELRLDYIRRAVNLKRLLADRPSATVVTVRRTRDGGQWEGQEEARQILLRSAIAEEVDYVDLEMDVADSIPRFGATKRIVSYHNFEETPDDLDEIHARICQLDPDIVKLATMAHHPQDNLRMLELIRTSKAPTVGMCMGEIGTPSRLLCGRYGAPFTYATFHHERSLAPGQLSYRQMTQIYQYDQIGKDTELFGVVADPVAHSLSPIVHNLAFQHLKMDRVYLPFRVPREDFGSFLQQCRELGIRGLSVTIPHKESLVPYLSDATEEVREVRAANTVIFDGEQLSGYNTDHDAAIGSVVEAIADPHSDNPLKGRPALLLGAGGVACAIAHGLKEKGAEVKIANRTPERAQQLADRVHCGTLAWEDRHRFKTGVVINATPIGMHPNVDETPFHVSGLDRKSVIFDTVYNPEQTLLVKEARARGCRTVTGVDMFVRQAALQFKLFTGKDAPLDVMRHAVRKAIGAARA